MALWLSPWKRWTLAAYVAATQPWRHWQMRRLMRRSTATIVILFYHRVAEHEDNDWTISFRHFRRQIDFIRKRFDMISLEEAQRRVRGGNHRPAVSITFDDGYADNCREALPLLIELGIPVTYFVTTDPVVRQEPFPHDVACGRPLAPNTVAQLRDLASAGVVLGHHTRTHPDLGQVSCERRLHDELVRSRDELADLLGTEIRYFAFPFGRSTNCSEQAVRMARDAGYWGVCTADGGYNWPGEDAFVLKRIHGDPDPARFRNWLTLDPRKMARPFQLVRRASDRGFPQSFNAQDQPAARK